MSTELNLSAPVQEVHKAEAPMINEDAKRKKTKVDKKQLFQLDTEEEVSSPAIKKVRKMKKLPHVKSKMVSEDNFGRNNSPGQNGDSPSPPQSPKSAQTFASDEAIHIPVIAESNNAENLTSPEESKPRRRKSRNVKVSRHPRISSDPAESSAEKVPRSLLSSSPSLDPNESNEVFFLNPSTHYEIETPNQSSITSQKSLLKLEGSNSNNKPVGIVGKTVSFNAITQTNDGKYFPVDEDAGLLLISSWKKPTKSKVPKKVKGKTKRRKRLGSKQKNIAEDKSDTSITKMSPWPWVPPKNSTPRKSTPPPCNSSDCIIPDESFRGNDDVAESKDPSQSSQENPEVQEFDQTGSMVTRVLPGWTAGERLTLTQSLVTMISLADSTSRDNFVRQIFPLLREANHEIAASFFPSGVFYLGYQFLYLLNHIYFPPKF